MAQEAGGTLPPIGLAGRGASDEKYEGVQQELATAAHAPGGSRARHILNCACRQAVLAQRLFRSPSVGPIACRRVGARGERTCLHAVLHLSQQELQLAVRVHILLELGLLHVRDQAVGSAA